MDSFLVSENVPPMRAGILFDTQAHICDQNATPKTSPFSDTEISPAFCNKKTKFLIRATPAEPHLSRPLSRRAARRARAPIDGRRHTERTARGGRGKRADPPLLAARARPPTARALQLRRACVNTRALLKHTQSHANARPYVLYNICIYVYI